MRHSRGWLACQQAQHAGVEGMVEGMCLYEEGQHRRGLLRAHLRNRLNQAAQHLVANVVARQLMLPTGKRVVGQRGVYERTNGGASRLYP